jgi:hypothetical protein
VVRGCVHHEADLRSGGGVGEQGGVGEGGLYAGEGSLHLCRLRNLVLGSGLSMKGIGERLQQAGRRR